LGGCICREVGGVYIEKGGVHVIVPMKWCVDLDALGLAQPYRLKPYIKRYLETLEAPMDHMSGLVLNHGTFSSLPLPRS